MRARACACVCACACVRVRERERSHFALAHAPALACPMRSATRTLDACAISTKWPSSPKPVTSVQPALPKRRRHCAACTFKRARAQASWRENSAFPAQTFIMLIQNSAIKLCCIRRC
eukprot:2736592-Pleurochrysis_carterae.AAC.1